MKKWKSADFIIALILSIAYFFVALLNLLGGWHLPLQNVQGPIVHPVLCLSYFAVALLITWTVYAISRHKAGRTSYFVAIIIGIALIIAGAFMWKVADKYEDVIINVEQQ